MAGLTDDELAVFALLAEKPGIVLPPLLAAMAEALGALGLAGVTAGGQWRLTEAGHELLRQGQDGAE